MKSDVLEKKKIIVGVCGSISAYKTCDLIRALRLGGALVRVVMTSNAQRMIAPATYACLSGNSVITDVFIEENERQPVHIGLADWADLLAIVPATGNIIGKAAAGIADDALSTTILSVDSPIIMAPAMNTRMYQSPQVRENIAKLEGWGVAFIGPVEGPLACGEEGKGRLAEIEEIAGKIREMLSK